jgi:leucyl aminopeptidase (aminopeptidase T)
VAGVLLAVLAAAQVGAADRPLRQKQKAIAAKIVDQVAGVKAGEIVLVGGDPADIDLVEDITLEAIKNGASAMQSVVRATFIKRYYDEVPADQDTRPRLIGRMLAENVDVMISINRQDDPGLLKDVPPERLAACAAAGKPMVELARKRKVRRVSLGNGLYPTRATARKYGISLRRLQRLFWSGLDVDYETLQRTGAELKGILAAGERIRVRHPNGTDLQFAITSGIIEVSDGVIAAEDTAAEGADPMTWLPAGEVIVLPDPGTAAGKVVYDRLPYQGGEIRKMVLTFEAGELKSVTARDNRAFKRWKRAYDAVEDAGKGQFAWLNFGINSAVKIPRGSKLLTWIPAGMVSCTIGRNDFFGGQNSANFNSHGFLPGATVEVDDRVVVKKGKLQI